MPLSGRHRSRSRTHSRGVLSEDCVKFRTMWKNVPLTCSLKIAIRASQLLWLLAHTLSTLHQVQENSEFTQDRQLFENGWEESVNLLWIFRSWNYFKQFLLRFRISLQEVQLIAWNCRKFFDQEHRFESIFYQLKGNNKRVGETRMRITYVRCTLQS